MLTFMSNTKRCSERHKYGGRLFRRSWRIASALALQMLQKYWFAPVNSSACCISSYKQPLIIWQ